MKSITDVHFIEQFGGVYDGRIGFRAYNNITGLENLCCLCNNPIYEYLCCKKCDDKWSKAYDQYRISDPEVYLVIQR